MNLRHGILGAATLILMSSVAFGQKQSGSSSTSTVTQPPSSRTNYPPMIGMPPMSGNDTSGLSDTMGSRIVEQQARSRNADRQKKIEADTDKLVGLTTSLKETVQEEKEISPAELSKKAEEIEKLARSVKDRMKG